MNIKLSTKISLISIIALLLSTAVLGFYFDTFLKRNYFKSSKEKITHARDRVVADFKHAQRELLQGVNFVETDYDLIASMQLINNYQDKHNYNYALLDEEKKEIAKYLLKKIKASFNQDARLYDKNAELVAYVNKEDGRYRLNFISYKNFQQIVYSKYENEKEYQKREYQVIESIPMKHVAYYSQPELKRAALITYHFIKGKIYITSHNSIFDEEDASGTGLHIEMSKLFDNTYFQRISKELDVNISLSDSIDYKKRSTELFDEEALRDENIIDEKDDYLSSFILHTKSQDAYLFISLGKEELTSVLNNNREQLVLFMFIFIVALLGMFNVLIHFGISNPIKKLMEQISRIKNGDYTDSSIIKTADELEEISENINMLAVAVANRESSLKASQNQLEYLSTHDELTGLLNRRSFSIKLEYALQKAERNKSKVAVLFLDLDEFKQVNDTLGHTIGDKLLEAVAHRLESSLRESDILARVGGDEFNIFVDGFKSITELQLFAQKLLDEFEEPFVDVDSEIISSTSIGIALFPDDGTDVETLIKNADLAMYKAKERGKNRFSFYSTKFSEYLQHRMNMIQALKSAIKNQNEFVLYYQPKISIKSQKNVGVEALIRWNSPELGFVRPDEFISIAEDTHMIIDIGTWVIKQACSDFMQLKEDGYNIGQVSVNISGVQLQHSDMLQTVKDVMASTSIQAHELELEVTESYIATNEKSAIETLSKFRNMGIDLAIDDFGTGYSSLSYLQALPISRLKIDKAFVDDLPNSKGSVAVVNAIIALAQSFELKITVEGVELEEQVNFFKDKYCDDIQGYYYSKPLPYQELKEFVKNNS